MKVKVQVADLKHLWISIKTQTKGKKRKRSVSDKAEKMESLVEKVMKMQSEGEQHYLRLEEKMLEIEEQRQKESREFQLQMIALLCIQRGQPQDSNSGRQLPGPTFNYHPMYSFAENADEYQ